jgi:hypothetical protein
VPQARAILRNGFSSPAINEDRTAVIGCQLAKIGKRGVYSDPQGNRHEITCTKGLIDGLLAICTENERINGHWTHDWILNNEEGIKTTAATWRNFRLDGQGNLIADAYLFPGQNKEAILHAAENDPQSMAVSMVFDWKGDANNPTAVAVSAADFVERGAITEALCRAVCAAATKETKTAILMEVADLVTLLSDPAVKTAIKAIVESHEDATDETVDPALMADVSEEDKKPDDEKMSAVARAVCQLSRSFNRRLKSIATVDNSAKLTPEIQTAIAAEVTKELGSKQFIGSGVIPKETGDKYTATLAKYRETAPDDVRAAARMLKDHPELLPAHEAATRARCMKLSPASL